MDANECAAPAPQKKRPALKIILIACLVIFLSPFLMFAGCASCALLTSPSTPEVQEEALRAGDSFTVDGIEYTIGKIGYGTTLTDDYLRIEYTAKNVSDEAKSVHSIPGSLYSPNGRGVDEKLVVTLADFSQETGDILPGYSLESFEAWAFIGSGEYTFVVDESSYKGKMTFKVQEPKGNSGKVKVTYETADGPKTFSFDQA